MFKHKPEVILALGLILFAALMGCSGNAGVPVASPDNNDFIMADAGNSTDRLLWGMWEIRFDPDTMAVEIELLRNVQAHFNITDFILPPVCDDCFAININGFDTVTRILDADVTLRNPMAINGRDVRGILFTNQYGHLVMNSDGWTELWDIPNGEDFNPFRAFAKTVPNRVFAGGSEHTENYLIKIPAPPNYWAIQFAVDASYPGNCKDPYQIGDLYGNFILYDYPGSSAPFLLDVFDWQDDIESVIIDAVEVTSDESTPFTHVSGNVWSVDLSNLESAAAGDYRCLVRAMSTNATIPLYQYVTLTVHESPAPIVTAINPDVSPAGEIITGVEITGEKFYGTTAQVRLMKTGEPDIVSGDVDVVNTTTISCEFNIPIDTAVGLYDVEVRNFNGTPGVGVGLFEIEPPVPDNPIDVTPDGLNFSPYDVTTSGNYAFVAGGENGLNIFDISDPVNPEWVHQVDNDDQALRIAIQGNYAYVADLLGGLLIYDISSPESASLYNTIGTINAAAVDVAGNYAYVVDRYDGLKIIDITTPGSPTILTTVDLSADLEFTDVAYSDGYAYVAAGEDGLKIIDVDPIIEAYIVDTIVTPSSTTAVIVENGLAYTCNEWSNFRIYDVDPPESATELKIVFEPVARGAIVAGDYAYVAAEGNGFCGLMVIDVNPPGDASVVKQIPTSPGSPAGVALFNGYAALIDKKIGLRVIDIDPIGSAIVVAEVDSPSGGEDVWVDNGHAYYTNETPGVIVADVTSPPDTEYVKRFDDIGGSGLYIENGYAYITHWDYGLHIYDIDPFESAYRIKSVELPEYANNLVVENGYAYVAATWDGDFHIVDVAPPGSAYLVTTVPTTSSCQYVDIYNGYAFVTGEEDGMYIIDIDPPASASIVNTVPIPPLCGQIICEEGYAYIAAESFQIVDIDPVGAAHIVKTVPLPDNGKGLHLSQGYAYVTCGPEGLQIIDIAPIDDASIIAGVPVKHYAIGIDVVDNMAYIGDIESGLRLVQLW